MTGLIAPALDRRDRSEDPVAPHVSRIRPPLRPVAAIDPAYSRLPIAMGFNWDEAFAAIDTGEWNLVVFRSRHRADADRAELTRLDERASTAARAMPGFLYYFIGAPLADGSCLSFCLWRSREDAVAAAAHPQHRAAMTEGLPCFAQYQLERYRVVKRNGKVGIEPVGTLGGEGGQGEWLRPPTPRRLPVPTVP